MKFGRAGFFPTCFNLRRSLMFLAARGQREKSDLDACRILLIPAFAHCTDTSQRPFDWGWSPGYRCGGWFLMCTIFPAHLSKIHLHGPSEFGSLWTHHSSNASTCRWWPSEPHDDSLMVAECRVGSPSPAGSFFPPLLLPKLLLHLYPFLLSLLHPLFFYWLFFHFFFHFLSLSIWSFPQTSAESSSSGSSPSRSSISGASLGTSGGLSSTKSSAIWPGASHVKAPTNMYFPLLPLRYRQGGRGPWQTKQSFRNGVWPAATCSFHDRARNFTVPFIGPSCSAVAIALIIKGGHLDKDLESSEIWALVFPSTPLGSPRWPGSGTWRSRFPPIVVGFVAGAANSDWLKVCTLRL